MKDRNTAMIATIATALLCGCPGLFGLCFGLTTAFASFVPGAQIDIFGSSDPRSATTIGFAALCLSLIFIAIPIVVGFVTLRKKPEAADEPPPTSPV
jgi:hypothetical protein